MEPELRDILRTTATTPVGDSHSHVSLYGPNSRWFISSENLSNFWISYCDLIDRKNNGRDHMPPEPTANICLAERAQEVMPIIANLSFRFQTDETDEYNWEPYDDEFLQALCSTYQEVISEFFSLTNETQMELVVTVLESSSHWYETHNNMQYMVMEIRLQFPYARIDTRTQNNLVRPRVIRLLRDNNIMSKIQRQPMGDWEQIISTTTLNDPVTMYGSSESQGRPKLIHTHTWPVITQEMVDSGIQPHEILLRDAFVPANHSNVHLHQAVNPEIFMQGHPLEYWLPLFFSVGYWPSVLLLKPEVNERLHGQTNMRANMPNQPVNQGFGSNRNRNDEHEQGEIEIAENMITMINHDLRFRNESSWLDIGKALYNSDEGGENGLRCWVRNSERLINNINPVPEFMLVAGNIFDTCRNLYYTFASATTTVKTLAWYAREDSPQLYSNWHRDWCYESMERALSCYHTDVAICLHRVYWLDFVFCPVGAKGKWFQFKNHRWSESNHGLELRRAISHDFMLRFAAARTDLSRQIENSRDDAFIANSEITIKKISTLIGKLKTVAFKANIMTEVSEHFNNVRFVDLLDTNPELTGVTNGLLEVCGQNIIFRAAKPEDYVSMCTNIPYHNLSFEHPLVRECMTWFTQVFPDDDLRKHFLKFSASCLKGRNSDKIFPIFTGEGDNSKSMIVKLFEAVFSSYCIKFDISNVTTRNTNSSGPTPQLARAKATRIAFMDEPEDDVPMNKGIIKKWVGGDSFFGRMLQDNGGDIQVFFKLVLTCNKVPIIPNADKAIKNRTRLFPYLSTWVDNPPEEESEQFRQRRFKKNPFFERRIPILAPAFLWIMTQYYPFYCREGLVDPEIVTQTTEEYWKNNDVYAQFTADSIQEVFTDNGHRDAASRVTLTEVYSEFKAWFKDAFPGNKVPERSVVRTELSSRWGRMQQGNAWHGISITSSNNSDMTSAIGGRRTFSQNPTIIAPTATINKIPLNNFSSKSSLISEFTNPNFDLSNPPGTVVI